jgi:hypothetical protein
VLVIDPPPPLSSLLFSQLLKKRRAAEYSVRRKGKGRPRKWGRTRRGERRGRKEEERGGREVRSAATLTQAQATKKRMAVEALPLTALHMILNNS